MIKRLFLSVIILALSTYSYANELTEDYYDIAQNYYSSNNIAKALEYIDIILSIDPKNERAFDLRDKISPLSEEDKEAEKKAIEMLEQYPGSEGFSIVEVPQENAEFYEFGSDYYNIKGLEFLFAGKYDDATASFLKSVEINNKNAEAYNNLATAYWQNGAVKEAEKYYKLANKKNKSYTQPLINLSNLYLQTGDYKNAKNAAKKAAGINPSDLRAYFTLGEINRKEGNYLKAVEYYKKVTDIDNKYANAYIKMSLAFFDTQDFSSCITTLNQYIELCPHSSFAYSLAAKAYAAQSKFVEAGMCINRALILCDCSEYRLEQAKILYNLGEFQKAQAAFEKIIQNNNSAEVFNYLGLCFLQQNNINSAILNFNEAIMKNPLKAIYYYNLAQCYKLKEDSKNYIKNINTALCIKPVSSQDYIDLSYIYFNNANVEQAIKTLDEAITNYPYNKSLYLSKLKIYEVMGNQKDYDATLNIIEKRFTYNEEE